MITRLRKDLLSSPAFLLVAGRTVGFVLAFAIPVVLSRLFTRTEFGTYKQLFLIYTTLYGLAQVGMAESLYFFIPKKPSDAGRHVANAIVTLGVVGVACIGALYWTRGSIAGWMTNADLAGYLPLIGVFLAFTLASAAFEIVMVSRKENLPASIVYAGSDMLRTVMIVAPAIALWGLRGVLIGAAVFAAIRLVAMLVYLTREFGRDLRPDLTLWREQLAYALPFALAVGIEVIQANLHQYLVASRFDAATFAIYAVGCLQIPLVDLICTSTANVMMVRMAEEAGQGRERSALSLWHNTTVRLASLIFPLAIFLLLTARGIIVTLFTKTYLPSVPIFMVWCLTIVPYIFTVDAVLRVYAQTRFLLILNIVRLAIIAALIGWFLTTFGLIGAVLITLVATLVVRVAGVLRIAHLLHVRASAVLPWRKLAMAGVEATVCAIPAYFVSRIAVWPAPIVVALTGLAYGVPLLAVRYGPARLKPSSDTTPRLQPSPYDNPEEIPPCVASQAS